MNLRELARGQRCTVRLPGICTSDDSVVLAHFRLMSVSGMGIKPPDLLGAYACGKCHAYVDTHKDAETQLAFAHGVLRTQAQLIKDGVVKW